MEKRLAARDLSFDPTPESDEEDTYSPAMYLAAADADPSVEVEREEWEDATADRLSRALGTLDGRSQDILKSRWMTENKATLHDLAARTTSPPSASARSRRTPSKSFGRSSRRSRPRSLIRPITKER